VCIDRYCCPGFFAPSHPHPHPSTPCESVRNQRADAMEDLGAWDLRQRAVSHLVPLVDNVRACTGGGVASTELEALERHLTAFRERVRDSETLTLRCLQCISPESPLHEAAVAHIAAIEAEMSSAEADARVVETLVVLGLLATDAATTRVLGNLLPERRHRQNAVSASQLCMREVRAAKGCLSDLLRPFSLDVQAFLRFVGA
jgi:hypothetical protein